MKSSYLCPSCRGFLNSTDWLVFSAKKKNGEMGLVFTHPEIGNYSIEHHRSFHIEQGELLKLYCPICHSSLHTAYVNPNLAKICMIDENHKEHIVLFSSVVGEHSTFKITEDKIETFGEHSGNYNISYADLVRVRY